MSEHSLIRVTLPYHLQNLAKVGTEVQLEVASPVTVLAVIRALEARYPTLRGAVLQHNSNQRRPLLRFFACSEDVTQLPVDAQLPGKVIQGEEPLMIVGAIAGG